MFTHILCVSLPIAFMTITVHKLVGLPKDNEMAKWALPEGFPILVEDETQRIIEEVLLLQIETRLVGGARNFNKRKHTIHAEAYDLKSWYDFLECLEWEDPVAEEVVQGKPWDLVNQTDYIAYRDATLDVISNITKNHLQDSTVSRRQHAIARLYKYAKAQGWYHGDLLTDKIPKTRRVRKQRTELAHTLSSNSETTEGSPHDLTYEYGEPVRPMTGQEWQSIKAELGPLPDESEDHRPVRDRVACELAITSGMRVDEIASLTKHQILDLDLDWRNLSHYEKENGYLILRITKTKRLKPRDVEVPAYLVPHLMAYYDGERKRTVAAGIEYAKRKCIAFKEPVAFFVNSESGPAQHAGKAIKPTSLSHAFTTVCETAGIVKHVSRIDLETRETYYVKVARHTFHDLRHTYAVWLYNKYVAEGDSEPWKKIQVLLGHANLETTRDTYLAVVTVDKRRAGKIQYEGKRKIAERYDQDK